MTKKIQCQIRKEKAELVKVRIIRAPLVNTTELKSVIANRARALIL